MSEPIVATISEALREVYDPCCKDMGISVVDMDCCITPNSTELRASLQPAIGSERPGECLPVRCRCRQLRDDALRFFGFDRRLLPKKVPHT